MRVPLSWLREYVDIPAEATPDDILASLVSVGFEEEDVHGFELTGPIVVGQVLDFVEEPQSNGKTIRWCQVQVAPDGEKAADGGEAVHGIVCGASNFIKGDKVVVTLPGAVLPGPFPIAARKTYGHVSDGMMASAKELGLGTDHAGIIRLVELGVDAAVGSDALALLGLDDVAIEINVTPDRGYALSVRGVAREYALATGATFRDPADVDFAALEQGTGFPITIQDDNPIRGRAAVNELVVRVVRDVDPSRPTPPFMVARLTLAGIRSLGVLIDITNYVMLELGNPMHGYDLDTLTGGITVRRAHEGETFETLDGQKRKLNVEDLLITDDKGAIGLAGVMGGLHSEMTDATRNVLVEAANFDTISIARAARRHKLPSEASKRFERGVDPLIGFVAARRVADLMVTYAGGKLDPAGGALFTEVFTEAIALPHGFVSGLIGVEYAAEEVVDALTRIGCDVTDGDAAYDVIPPTWRPDLTDKWTLAEEVARVHGLDRVPAVLPTPPSGRGFTMAQQARRRVSNALAAAGFVETPSFPFTTAEANNLHGSATGAEIASIKLANPLDGQAPYLRRSLIPGLLTVAHRNASRGLTDLSLFETGAVFVPEAGVTYGTADVPPLGERPSDEKLAELNASIPPQPRHVAVLVAGNTAPKQPGRAAEPAGLIEVLDAVRVLANAAGVHVHVQQGERAALHPGRTGVLTVDGVEVGYVGELLPSVAEEADLHGRVTVAELDLDAIVAAAGDSQTVANLSSYPAATQDVSLIVPVEVPASEVAAALVAGSGELLESTRLVDDYRGQGVDAGSKSVTFALRFRATDRTLTAAEATDAKMSGVKVATERFGAQLRE